MCIVNLCMVICIETRHIWIEVIQRCVCVCVCLCVWVRWKVWKWEPSWRNPHIFPLPINHSVSAGVCVRVCLCACVHALLCVCVYVSERICDRNAVKECSIPRVCGEIHRYNCIFLSHSLYLSLFLFSLSFCLPLLVSFMWSHSLINLPKLCFCSFFLSFFLSPYCPSVFLLPSHISLYPGALLSSPSVLCLCAYWSLFMWLTS